MTTNQRIYDAIIIGGGPAGLSAALYLGRTRKDILVIDADDARHAQADGIHNFVTRDGMKPADFRIVAWDQMAAYPNVERNAGYVERVSRSADDLHAVHTASSSFVGRTLLLATGVRDVLPDILGFTEHWGTSVFQCPFCHGWEVRDRPVALFTDLAIAPLMAKMVGNWSSDVTVVTNGASFEGQIPGVTVRTEAIQRLHGQHGRLERIEFDAGPQIEVEALFFHAEQRQSPLVADMELELDEDGFVVVDAEQRTQRSGIWAAGDLTGMRAQNVIHSASHGGVAAVSIFKSLMFGM